ncbi:MAG: TonB-dependent receptor [Pseudomonadales bacterium]
MAVTALPENILKDSILANSEDLTALVPSLNLQKGSNPRQTSFNIRGIGTQSFSSGVEPSVSTVVDGVVMGRSGMAFMQLLDVARVEVLRGPQGTLFGKNSSGGVVHIISKDPGDEFEAEVLATAVERSEYRAGFTVSAPISESVGFRLSGSGVKDEGYLKNEFNGEDINKTDEWSIRGKLRFTPTESLDLKWSSDYRRKDGDCCTSTIRSINPFLSATDAQIQEQNRLRALLLPVVPSEENTRVNEDADSFIDSEVSGHALEINWDIGEHTLTSITAIRDWEQVTMGDTDGTPEQGIIIQSADDEQSQFTQELRITSPADQFASYVAGLYYFDLELDRQFLRTLFPLTPAISGTAISDIAVDSLNYAAFGEVTFNISENFRVITGTRFTHDEIEFDFVRTSTSPFTPEAPFFEKEESEDDFSIKVAAEWNVSDAVMTYISYAQGYKGPAFNVVAGSTEENTNPVSPETADAYEMGMKSSWFDSRLILNVAVFYSEYQDFQAQTSEARLILDENGNTRDVNMDGNPDTAFSFVLNNVGEVSTRGLEVDFIAQASENLSLFGGLTLVDAEIDSYPNGPCNFTQQTRGIGFNGQMTCEAQTDPSIARAQDLSGGDLPQSPDWKVTLAANYTIPFQSLPFDIVLKGNYRIQDEVQYGIEQDEFTVQDSYDVLDLSFVLRDKDERYSITAFVKNALDEFYVASINGSAQQIIPNGYTQQVPKTARRTAGLEFRYQWF